MGLPLRTHLLDTGQTHGSAPTHPFTLHPSTHLPQALLNVSHNLRLFGVCALGRGNAIEVDLAGESDMLLDLIFAGHGATSE